MTGTNVVCVGRAPAVHAVSADTEECHSVHLSRWTRAHGRSDEHGFRCCKPDLERIRNFRDAFTMRKTAELGLSCIFIPPSWSHHSSESLEPFMCLVNYWLHDRWGADLEPIRRSMRASLYLEHPRTSA